MSKRGQSKAIIIESYLRLSRKQGLENITLQMLADESGLSFGTIHYYYGGDKESIKLAALVFVADQARKYTEEHMKKPVKGEGASENLLLRYFTVTLDWTKKYPSYSSYWLHFYFLSATNLIFQKIMNQARDLALQRIEMLLARELLLKQKNISARSLKVLCLEIHNYMVGALVIFVARNFRALDKNELVAYYQFTTQRINSL